MFLSMSSTSSSTSVIPLSCKKFTKFNKEISVEPSVPKEVRDSFGNGIFLLLNRGDWRFCQGRIFNFSWSDHRELFRRRSIFEDNHFPGRITMRLGILRSHLFNWFIGGCKMCIFILHLDFPTIICLLSHITRINVKRI